jgi:hypothetical protein
MTHAPAPPGSIGTGILFLGPAPVFAAAKLCDDCYEHVTGLCAECLDLCRLSLNHAGLCHPRKETDQSCQRCGETGHRLTEHEPQDAAQAVACLPLDVPGRIAYLEAVAAGCSTARGDGHCDDADCPLCEPDPGRELDALRDLAAAEFEVTYWVPTQYRVRLNAVQAARAISHHREELGVAGPEGEAADWDDAETYHVYVLAETPATGAGSEATDAPA